MIVVDASAAVSALLHRDAARAELAQGQIHVPHLIDAEVTSALRRQVAAGRMNADAAWRSLSVWQRLAMTRYPVFGLFARLWELRNDLSAYDATYVALAESLDCHLLSADARLARAPGVRCPVTVVPR